MIASALLLAVGCAAQIPPSERIIKAVAIAHPPIGKVVPVLVAMNCENCEHSGLIAEPFIKRENVYALNSSGQYVRSLSDHEAERDAGRPEGLASLLTYVTADQALDAYEANHTLGSTCPELLHLFMYLPGAPSVQRAKLEAITLQDWDPGLNGPLRCRQLNYNNGWVFFPLGNYTGVRIDASEFEENELGLSLHAQTRVFKQLELPWIEQQGIPQGNYPTLRSTD